MEWEKELIEYAKNVKYRGERLQERLENLHNEVKTINDIREEMGMEKV